MLSITQLMQTVTDPYLKMGASKPSIQAKWLGLVSYQEGLFEQTETAKGLLQSKLQTHFSKDSKGSSGTLLGLEHPKTITLGKRGDPRLDLKVSQEQLGRLGFEIYTIDRGGQATLHNPGQLVIYPILHLKDLSLTVRSYVDLLLQVTYEVLHELGIEACFHEARPGLYTSQGKIASVGIRVQNGISLHGISINISNDLGDFQWIHACGDPASSVDRLVDHGPSLSLQELFNLWAHRLSHSFPITRHSPQET